MHTYMWALSSKSRAPRSFNPITYYLMFSVHNVAQHFKSINWNEEKSTMEFSFIERLIQSAARCLCFIFCLVSIQFIISILSPSIHVLGVVVSVDSLAARISCFCFLCNQKNISYSIFVDMYARLCAESILKYSNYWILFDVLMSITWSPLCVCEFYLNVCMYVCMLL